METKGKFPCEVAASIVSSQSSHVLCGFSGATVPCWLVFQGLRASSSLPLSLSNPLLTETCFLGMFVFQCLALSQILQHSARMAFQAG